MSRRVVVMLAALLGLSAGAGAAVAAFTATTSSDGATFSAKRISSASRAATSWAISDASDGSAADFTEATAAADALFFTTKPIAATWSASRYVELDAAGFAPAGLSTPSVDLLFDFADGAGGGAEVSCFYFDVRRRSTGAVLGTFGSPASPIACETTQTIRRTTTSIASVVPDSTVADDLRIRFYVQNVGANDEMRIDRAAVRVGRYGATWTMPMIARVDQSDGVAAGGPYGPAEADSAYHLSDGNWSSTFSPTRSITFAFPSMGPTGASVTGARLVHSYRSNTAGDTTCWYFEVLSAGTVIGTHGSAASPVSCNATTSYVTDTISLPEVDTGAEAAGLSVRVYARNSGGRPTRHDVVSIEVDYGLAATGCVSPGAVTVLSTADTFSDQNAPASPQGTNADIKVKSQNGSRNRRGYVRFDLPPTPEGCVMTGATLRLFQGATQGTRTMHVARAASAWTEAALTWSNQPASTGTAVAATNAAGWRTWDVLTHVTAMQSGSNHGFVVKDATEDAATAAEQQYDSREAANDPQLVVTFG